MGRSEGRYDHHKMTNAGGDLREYAHLQNINDATTILAGRDVHLPAIISLSKPERYRTMSHL